MSFGDSEPHVVAALAAGATHAMPSIIATVASSAMSARPARSALIRSVVDVATVMLDALVDARNAVRDVALSLF